METKPKTKSQLICEYKAAHPEVSVKELQTVFGTSRQMVMYAIDPETRRKQAARDKAYYERDKKAYYKRKRQYQIEHREQIKAYKRRYHAEKKAKSQNIYKRHGQTWTAAYTKAEAIRQYTAEHPEATIKEVCEVLKTHSNCISTAAPQFYKAKVRKPVERPVSNEAAALQRECDRLLEEMALCTTAEYPALARRYSELQIRLDYALTMANDANRELVRSRALMEKQPLCQRVANGGGFTHH